MIWQDILVEGAASEHELRAAFAKSFGVKLDEVEVVKNFERAVSARVVCHVQQRKGEFMLMVSVYVKAGLNLYGEEAVLRRLSKVLGARLLVSSETADPYVMRLVHDDDIRLVDIDVTALDERDEYVLA